MQVSRLEDKIYVHVVLSPPNEPTAMKLSNEIWPVERVDSKRTTEGLLIQSDVARGHHLSVVVGVRINRFATTILNCGADIFAMFLRGGSLIIT